LRSRERASALKRDNYTCQICGRKQSRVKGKECKVEVHHIQNILNWPELYDAVRRYLLVDPDKLKTLCVDCHKDIDNEMP